jgi:hypothetical protein
VLVESGLPNERIAAVAGRADQDPLLPDDPISARNRRITIVLLRKQPPAPPPGEAAPVGAAPAGTGAPAGPASAPNRSLQKDWTGPRVR